MKKNIMYTVTKSLSRLVWSADTATRVFERSIAAVGSIKIIRDAIKAKKVSDEAERMRRCEENVVYVIDEE